MRRKRRSGIKGIIGVVLSLLIAVGFVFQSMKTEVKAFERIQDDTDLSAINLYQFSLKQDNMEILHQGEDVERSVLPANGSWKESTVFSLKVDKTKDTQTFAEPVKLKFTDAGEVYGRKVDVYINVNSVTANLSFKNADYYDASKNLLPVLTVDENWGTKSIQIMDYIYPDHPTVTNDMSNTYWMDADVTAELRYQDGSICDLKMVMLPSDVDVISGNLKESFSLYDIQNSVGKLVTNNAFALSETVSGDKTTWTPATAGGTSGAYAEHNVAGMAVRSTDNKIHFSYGTTASCGGLFGFYTEVPAEPPVKAVKPERAPARPGEGITYTTGYTMPVPGKDVIGDISSMKMIDTFDERLDYKSLEVRLNGNLLAEGPGYTVEVNGQKVTVSIDKKYLTRDNAGGKYTIVYKAVTNDKILTNGADIENRVEQRIDNVPSYSDTVKTELYYNKTHEYVSGIAGKELPKSVKDLLPDNVGEIPNGTEVVPDGPKGNIAKVSVPEGNWIFKGYDNKINNADVHFIGKWVLEEFDKPVKEVYDSSGINIDGKNVNRGDILTYKISYKNTADSARYVMITDRIPEFTSYVHGSVNGGGLYADGKIT